MVGDRHSGKAKKRRIWCQNERFHNKNQLEYFLEFLLPKFCYLR